MYVQLGHLQIDFLWDNLHVVQKLYDSFLELFLSLNFTNFRDVCCSFFVVLDDPKRRRFVRYANLFSQYTLYLLSGWYSFLIDKFPCLFLYILTSLEMVAIVRNKIFLRLLDPHDLSFYDRIWHVFLNSFPLHTFYIERIYHFLRGCQESFISRLLIFFLLGFLIFVLVELLQKSIVMDVISQ